MGTPVLGKSESVVNLGTQRRQARRRGERSSYGKRIGQQRLMAAGVWGASICGRSVSLDELAVHANSVRPLWNSSGASDSARVGMRLVSRDGEGHQSAVHPPGHTHRAY